MNLSNILKQPGGRVPGVINQQTKIDMKSLELQLKKRLLIVEDAEHGSFFPPKWSNYKLEKDGEVWKSISRGSDLTEEIAAGLVEKVDAVIGGTALESFLSAISHEGYFWGNNPVEKPEKTSNFYFREIQEHFKAESLTFHPERIIIFESVE